MKELMLLCGPPVSGKDYYADHNLPRHFKINQDDQGRDGHVDAFLRALERLDNIVVCRMNLTREQRLRYIKPARDLGYRVSIVVLHVPHETRYNRFLERQNHPTIITEEDFNKATNYFFKAYERPTIDECDELRNEGWELCKYGPKVIICDIDGTIANIEHRRKFVSDGNKNWKGFFEAMSDDTPYTDVALIVEAMMGRGYSTIFVSGRPEEYRNKTLDWAGKHGIFMPELFMRPKGNYIGDEIVKQNILDFELKTRYNILFWLDDRRKVINMIRSNGIRCLEVQEGSF